VPNVIYDTSYVGATARTFDEPVLTNNTEDFATLDVPVESY